MEMVRPPLLIAIWKYWLTLYIDYIALLIPTTCTRDIHPSDAKANCVQSARMQRILKTI